MKRLSGSRKVERSLKKARQDVRAALKELNQHAGSRMSKGDYAAAGELAERGRMISDFEGRLDALRREWRGLWSAKESTEAKDTKTPLWEYYQPILEALGASGGKASRVELERRLESTLIPRLKSGDLKPMGRRGAPRWKLMVRRAHKPMIHEKYLEDHSGKQWRITSLGRQVAEGSIKVPAEA
jgi:hypothetical protein